MRPVGEEGHSGAHSVALYIRRCARKIAFSAMTHRGISEIGREMSGVGCGSSDGSAAEIELSRYLLFCWVVVFVWNAMLRCE